MALKQRESALKQRESALIGVNQRESALQSRIPQDEELVVGVVRGEIDEDPQGLIGVKIRLNGVKMGLKSR